MNSARFARRAAWPPSSEPHTLLIPGIFLLIMGSRTVLQNSELFSIGLTLNPPAVHVAIHALIAELHQMHHHGHSRWRNLMALRQREAL